MQILVIHGPNLNLLGTREVKIYGKTTLAEINSMIKKKASGHGMKTRILQSNHEGKIIDFLHGNRKWAQAVVINPAALTHYSIAIRDAISAVSLPCVEVHLSDIAKREPWRRKSVISGACVKTIKGHGPQSYLMAIDFLAGY